MDNLTSTTTPKKASPIRKGIYTAIVGAVLALLSFSARWIVFAGKKVDSLTIYGWDMSGQLSGAGKIAHLYLRSLVHGVSLAWPASSQTLVPN